MGNDGNGRSRGDATGTSARLSTGISMYYESRGDGDPLVLIMGSWADHSPWDPAAEVYSRSYRVITFDQRGTGRSDRPADPESYTVAGMADDVAALLDHLEVPVCHVAGMSLGSAIAQELALRHPGRLATLQLHATWGRTDEWMRRMFESLGYLLDRPDLEAFFRTDSMWISSASLLNEDPVALAAAERDMLSDPYGPTRVTVRGHLHADLGHDALDRLHQIHVPTLITSGELDWQVPMRYGVEVSERIDGSRFHLFKGPRASHNLFSEMADDFYGVTLEFLSDNPLGTSPGQAIKQRSERL